MNLRILALIASAAVVVQGCKHVSPAPKPDTPAIRISNYEVIKVPTGGGNIHLDGVGATPNSEVILNLNYSVGYQDTEQLLKIITSDGTGAFTYWGYQECVFATNTPGPTGASLEARDTATGTFSRTHNLDPSFLICPK